MLDKGKTRTMKQSDKTAKEAANYCPVCNGVTFTRTVKQDKELLDKLMGYALDHNTWCLLWSLVSRNRNTHLLSIVEVNWVRERTLIFKARDDNNIDVDEKEDGSWQSQINPEPIV